LSELFESKSADLKTLEEIKTKSPKRSKNNPNPIGGSEKFVKRSLKKFNKTFIHVRRKRLPLSSIKTSTI
jgi:hypothetical protein